MSAPAPLPPPPRSWRDISQNVAPVVVSREGRKRYHRRNARLVLLSLVGAVSLWAGYEIYTVLAADPTRLKAPVKATPVRSVSLRTDGVLDLTWVKARLALPKDADLMQLDLFQLRARLLSHPQVRTAVVTRRFPDTVAVVLEERTPVARVLVQGTDGKPAEWSVARDGVVFEPVGQRQEILQTLPHLEGINLRRVGRGYAPLDGMESVSDLLSAARGDAGHLFSTWRVLHLSRLRSDGLIRVQTQEIPDITFGVRDDFTRQLAQLDYVLDQLKIRAPYQAVQSINLAVGLSANGIQVPVSFAGEPETPAGEAPLAAVPATTPVRETTARTFTAPRRPTTL